MLIEGQVGPRTVGDGAFTELRQTRFGAVVGQNSRSKNYEAVVRGRVFTASTATAGTTIVAANAAPPAAAGATILTLYNPLGSGINAVLLRALVGNVSGTPGVGGFQYCVSFNNKLTATPNSTARCNLLCGASSQCQVFTQTALTAGLVHVNLRAIGVQTFAGALAATATNLVFIDQPEGDIVVPPGGLLTIANAATGTTHVVYASFTWEETSA